MLRADDTAPQEPAPHRRGPWRRTARAAQLTAVTGLGIGLLVVGTALLVLPGPGLLVILCGLGLLSTEYHWPRRLGDWLRQRVDRAGRRLTHRRRGRVTDDEPPSGSPPTSSRP